MVMEIEERERERAGTGDIFLEALKEPLYLASDICAHLHTYCLYLQQCLGTGGWL